MQYVDRFHARLENVKYRKVQNWGDAFAEASLVSDMTCAVRKKFAMATAEESLRDALRAQDLDTQLSEDTLQRLKVC